MRKFPDFLGVAVLLLTGALFPAHAGQIVLFSDGRSMEVEGLEIGPEAARLALPGGGEISVPLDRISHWETLPPKPEPPAPQPPSDEVSGAGEAWRLAAGDYASIIEGAARRHGLDPALLTAVAQVESAFDPGAVSPKGARGLLQLMPATADRFGVRDPFDAGQNVQGGAEYLSWLLDRFDGRTELALAGYNAGEGAVDRYRGIPPYKETQAYVSRVLTGAERLGR